MDEIRTVPMLARGCVAVGVGVGGITVTYSECLSGVSVGRRMTSGESAVSMQATVRQSFGTKATYLLHNNSSGVV